MGPSLSELILESRHLMQEAQLMRALGAYGRAQGDKERRERLLCELHCQLLSPLRTGHSRPHCEFDEAGTGIREPE